MRQSIVRITTHDTKKTYEYGADIEGDRPQLWEATLALKCVDQNGRTGDYHAKSVTVYLERETLERHKLVPQPAEPKRQPLPYTETPEDLLLRLLEAVGVYPEAES
jgi:hypothetical protein